MDTGHIGKNKAVKALALMEVSLMGGGSEYFYIRLFYIRSKDMVL